jgi:hypothetical protein
MFFGACVVGWGVGNPWGGASVHGCLCAAIGFVKEEKKDVFVFCLLLLNDDGKEQEYP